MWTRFLAIKPVEVSFARRGFTARRDEARLHLEARGGAFVAGYNLAVRTPRVDRVLEQLRQIPLEHRGFAFEGASMALGLVAQLPFCNRQLWTQFLAAAPEHDYMLHVGLGWAWAKLPWKRWSLPRQMGRLDPLLGWLAIDGFGFHEGFFSPRRTVFDCQTPRLAGYHARAFDQGVGRALWFVGGTDPDSVADLVRKFPPGRHADLWAGLGLAMTYAGGAPLDDVDRLLTSAGPHQASLAQGVAFAAQARRKAGNPTQHTESICQHVWGVSAEAAADVTVETLACLPAVDLPGSPVTGEPVTREPAASKTVSGAPRYEQWRRLIRLDWSRRARAGLSSQFSHLNVEAIDVPLAGGAA